MTEVYQPNPKHRNGHQTGSQWTIPEVAEIDSFRLAEERGWLLSDVGWGLHFVGNSAAYLGLAVDRERRLFLAKFVSSANPPIWHG